MKKTLAILLSCIMLFACVPFTASAATTLSNVETITAPMTISAGETVIVTGTYTAATTITLMQGAELIIQDGGSVIITGETGRLINSGTVTVKRNGTLSLNGIGSGAQATLVNNETGVIALENSSLASLSKNSQAFNYGNIKNIDRMDIKGTLSHQITIPGAFSANYSYVETYNNKNFTTDFTVSFYIPQEGDDALAYTDESNYILNPNEKSVSVIHGQKLYVMITPEEGLEGDWCDVGRMQLTAGGQNLSAAEHEQIPNDRGVFCISPANALQLGIYSTAYKDIVKIYEIILPNTDGYYVISKDGDVDEATVEYGKVFSFRVVLAPEYDKSESYVYVNALYMEPDEYGYYDITGPILKEGMATAGGIQEDIEIQVMGVSSNESQAQMSSLVGFIQQIFSIIEEIFSYFTGIFSGLGDSLGLGA